MESTERYGYLRKQIDALPDGVERDALIDRFETEFLLTRSVHLDFYIEWLKVHQVDPYECWTDEGYDPSKSPISRDVQILVAVVYGLNDIDNGGLQQFFYNPTGQFAPEMVEWFERAGLADGAKVLRKAMDVFGPKYPRSQAQRQAVLKRFTGETREQWDPFFKLDPQFGEATPDAKFVECANKWLRETCGIKRLRDKPPMVTP